MPTDGQFKSITIQRGTVAVEIVYIGEGLCGDYNPDDPEDKQQLRFYVQKADIDDSGEMILEDVENASYCLRIQPHESGIGEVAGRILDAVYDKLMNGESIKELCEGLSWITARSA